MVEISSTSKQYIVINKNGFYICKSNKKPYWILTKNIKIAKRCPNEKYAKSIIKTYREFTGDKRKNLFKIKEILYCVSSIEEKCGIVEHEQGLCVNGNKIY